MGIGELGAIGELLATDEAGDVEFSAQRLDPRGHRGPPT